MILFCLEIIIYWDFDEKHHFDYLVRDSPRLSWYKKFISRFPIKTLLEMINLKVQLGKWNLIKELVSYFYELEFQKEQSLYYISLLLSKKNLVL